MLYGQHRAFQKTIMSTFFVFRLECKFLRFIYLFKEAMDINSNKDIPKQLTPVTVDTISSVKSRI